VKGGLEMLNTRLIALVVGMVFSIVVASDTAQGHTPPPVRPARNPSLVWKTAQTTVSIERLASICAPVLWFSPDEPLLVRNGGPNAIPTVLPEDTPTNSAIVYYQCTELVTRSRIDKPVGPGTAVVLKELKRVVIDYYFSYEKDYGLGGHRRDVERIRVHLKRKRAEQENLSLIEVTRIEGYAHGLFWLRNNVVTWALDNEDVLVLPITILVEEGKHASCPDRNADGYYTPGYDVNVLVNDAWGIRDPMRSGRVGSHYKAWMTKARDPRDRVLPPKLVDYPMSKPDTLNYAAGVASDSTSNRYMLRYSPGQEWKKKLSKGDYGFLLELLDKNDVGEPPKTGGPLHAVYGGLAGPDLWENFNLSWRYDEQSMLTATVPNVLWAVPAAIRNRERFMSYINETPIVGGFLGFKFDLGTSTRADKRGIGYALFYTPSTSRWIDWYGSVGIEQIGRGSPWQGAVEAGYKFRITVPKFPALFKFLGVRAGLRSRADWGELDRGRFVFEIGGGAH
jgi:hypothetical protein